MGSFQDNQYNTTSSQTQIFQNPNFLLEAQIILVLTMNINCFPPSDRLILITFEKMFANCLSLSNHILLSVILSGKSGIVWKKNPDSSAHNSTVMLLFLLLFVIPQYKSECLFMTQSIKTQVLQSQYLIKLIFAVSSILN